MIGNHIIAFGIGFILDLIIGDPHWLPHPVCAIGNLIGTLEKKLNRGEYRKQKGIMLVISVLACTGAAAGIILFVSYKLSPFAGIAAEALMTGQILATKSLKTESMKVYDRLKNGTLQEARTAVSMIVGRDTDVLDEIGVAKAAVETVAENTSDGVVAPMLYLAAGGPVLGFLYKAVNTMDSMVGYKNERFLDFGRAAARLDDAVNFLPARISALLMIAASVFCGREFDAGRAWRIFKRDRRKHASPNSAQTESVCAGALGIRLAGDASYFGQILKKQYIGDAIRSISAEDIRLANRILYGTAFLCEMLCLAALAGWALL